MCGGGSRVRGALGSSNYLLIGSANNIPMETGTYRFFCYQWGGGEVHTIMPLGNPFPRGMWGVWSSTYFTEEGPPISC